MNKMASIVLGAVVVGAGAGLVVLADRMGWLPGEVGQASAELCRHELGPGQCAFCDPALIEKLGFCAGHGVPEAFCTRCNPSLIPAFKIENDWCAPHEVPESQCVICHPDLAQAGLPETLPSLPQASIELVSDRSPTPRAQRDPSASCTKTNTLVQFKSEQIARQAGLELAEAAIRPITQTLECNAELAFDGDQLAHLSPRAAGVVARVEKHLGDRVAAGDLLVVVDSVELGGAKAEYLQALAAVNLWQKNFERQNTLAQTGDIPTKSLIEAETSLTEARIALARAKQHLRNLGLDDRAVDEVEARNDTSALLEVRAPFAGLVIDRHAVLGEVVDSARVLFSVADTSRMWAMLSVYEADVAAVKVGQRATLSFGGLEGQTFGGEITWVSAQVDPETRTLQARAVVNNPEGVLRANMFGRATVTIHDRAELLVVPRAAVQWDGCCNVVFVQRSATTFEPRKVKLGREADRMFVVESGLEAGEIVVAQGSFLLKTEIMKGSIGAGCCEAHPPSSG